MHSFDEIICNATRITLAALDESQSQIISKLQTGAATSSVKYLQMIQTQKAIFAIGMFSLFESVLQMGLSCNNGFDEAKKILSLKGNSALLERLNEFISAINVLKHGRGRSYDTLIASKKILPFKMKQEDDGFFDRGDVSEIATLIEVDNRFILDCMELIENVSEELRTGSSYYSF